MLNFLQEIYTIAATAKYPKAIVSDKKYNRGLMQRNLSIDVCIGKLYQKAQIVGATVTMTALRIRFCT
eukprot:snap_masked-scaffold_2-processed-gene-3.27-mRNA-1 protein AED:1.00 eAED:1.00 QI:0/0/0/0/1/1/2/0/67